MAGATHGSENEDDFDLVKEFPIRTKPAKVATEPNHHQANGQKANTTKPNIVKDQTHQRRHEVKLEVDRIDDQKLLLSITPPREPGSGQRNGSDIVLVIDVSGSMASAAELPDQAQNDLKESSGLSILDLVKHSSRTILSKLDERDRLAIVTFSTKAKVVLPLTRMTHKAKDDADIRIEQLQPLDITNLWAGIREGLELFKDHSASKNSQGLFVLTDGVPNYMCPAQGYVQKIKEMLSSIQEESGAIPTISTFGFGYSLRSGLLRSIAEVGGGNYAFIPDAGMIGTVFVHAVANLFTTFSRQVKIVLRGPADVDINLPQYLNFDIQNSGPDSKQLTIANLQYGQSRNIIIEAPGLGPTLEIHAACQYASVLGDGKLQSLTCQSRPSQQPKLFIDYHLVRHEVCRFLYSFSTQNLQGEYLSIPSKKAFKLAIEAYDFHEFIAVHDKATKGRYGDEPGLPDIRAILSDMIPPDPEDPHNGGQIMIALTNNLPDGTEHPQMASNGTTHVPGRGRGFGPSGNTHYDRWGHHYLPSVLHAHMRQMCLTFKDPGPLCYSSDSPLFIKVRNELDKAFDMLPPPKPSRIVPKQYGVAPKATSVVNMSRYRSARNPCFLGDCLVKIDDGEYRKVNHLRTRDYVWTPKGQRKIQEIVVTDTKLNGGTEIIDITTSQTLSITPWHPIFDNDSGRWIFPGDTIDLGSKKCEKRRCEEPVYSILLDGDFDSEGHAIEVGGTICVTLGHGIVSRAISLDTRAHTFFGDHTKVVESITKLETDVSGRRKCGGITKAWNGTEFVADGFMRPGSTSDSMAPAIQSMARL